MKFLPMKAQLKTPNTRKGVSLLISIVLIAIITAFAMGISNLVISAIRNTGNVNNANMAYYAAEGALEQGLLLNAEVGAGYSAPVSAVTLCKSGEVCAAATVQIQGTVPAALKYLGGQFYGKYGIPSPGSGNVENNCNPLNAAINDGVGYDINGDGVIATNETIDPADHPCNWNKLKVGDSVSIPLYTSSTSGTNQVIKNPADLGLSEIIVRIRTACKDGAVYCNYQDRMVLDAKSGDPFFACDNVDTFINCGDTIVYWEITGSNIGGDKVYGLRALDTYEPEDGIRKGANSEIYEYKINKASLSLPPGCSDKRYCVLMQTNYGYNLANVPSKIQDFLSNVGITIPADYINKPVLKLKAIYSLKEFDMENSIPYLEYQVLMNTSTTATPANVSQTITAEGLSGTFKQVLEVKQPQETGLLEYVINQ